MKKDPIKRTFKGEMLSFLAAIAMLYIVRFVVVILGAVISVIFSVGGPEFSRNVSSLASIASLVFAIVVFIKAERHYSDKAKAVIAKR